MDVLLFLGGKRVAGNPTGSDLVQSTPKTKTKPQALPRRTPEVGVSDMQVGSGRKVNQVHHFATNKSRKYTSQFENITKKYGLDLDENWNKELMPHQGRHPYAYHDDVLDNMQKFDKIAKGDKTKFLKLYNQMKQKIINNPDMLCKDYWNKL